MDFQVINRSIHAGEIRVSLVTTASILLVGDAEKISLSSLFDTPPESVEFMTEPRFGIEMKNHGVGGCDEESFDGHP
ncbi:spore germination protein (modular protein) [[Clostridium] ultunense Esp]|uniref:hypothetical protein n=1 Tax=Thermicanus aegyptius TaxID=94009 RepID=UPI0002B6F569|nr:hypothetical protein [Thermicanus aegyptius]CCQ92473.1 spore germination protein (modular protein) [[Clostridium] ultunense Esp]